MVTPRPIVNSYNHNYFNRLTISSATFGTQPDVILGLTGDPSLSLINEGTGTIQYSFNGSYVAGDLVPGTPSAQMVFNHRGYSQIWFRLSSGSASNIRVEATANGELLITGGGGGSTGPAENVVVTGSLPAGSNTIGSVKITDGTNTETVKAASTAAVATDTALVVAVSPNNVVVTNIADPTTPANKVSVSAFHNSDNQALPASGNSILTAGVAQFLNPTGTSDRQRSTGVDGVTSVGVASGSAQFAQKFKTTVALAVSSTGSQTVTPASMTGIQVNSILVYDLGGTNQETIVVTAVTGTTFTAVFAKTHGTNVIINGFVYNQERDAAGELDGASGIGTAIAASYEYNGGSPGGGFFDRERNVQGKGVTTTTITSGASSSSTSVVLGAVTGLQPGAPLYFQGGTPEIAYVDINYVPGQTTVPLQSALVNTHSNGTNVQYDSYAINGPAGSAILPTGIGVEVDALQYNSTAPSLTNGQFSIAQCDSLGNEQCNLYTAIAGEDLTNNLLATQIKPIAASTYSPSLFTNFASNTTLNIKASAGNVFSIYCVNANAAVRYIQILNTATTGTSGTTVPILSFAVPASGGNVLITTEFFSAAGIYLSTGIAFGFSTTSSVYTAGTASDMTILHVTYI
jgi:hypothetical protein